MNAKLEQLASIAYNEMISKELGCDSIKADYHSLPTLTRIYARQAVCFGESTAFTLRVPMRCLNA